MLEINQTIDFIFNYSIIDAGRTIVLKRVSLENVVSVCLSVVCPAKRKRES